MTGGAAACASQSGARKQRADVTLNAFVILYQERPFGYNALTLTKAPQIGQTDAISTGAIVRAQSNAT